MPWTEDVSPNFVRIETELQEELISRGCPAGGVVSVFVQGSCRSLSLALECGEVRDVSISSTWRDDWSSDTRGSTLSQIRGLSGMVYKGITSACQMTV